MDSRTGLIYIILSRNYSVVVTVILGLPSQLNQITIRLKVDKNYLILLKYRLKHVIIIIIIDH